MSIKYCGDCDFFDAEEEGSKKGYCQRIKAYVWDDDFIPETDESCYHFEE